MLFRSIPESFKVLVKELQSLALDVRVLDESGEEIELSELVDEDDGPMLGGLDDMDIGPVGEEIAPEEGEGDLSIEEDPDDDFGVSLDDLEYDGEDIIIDDEE